MLIGEERKKKKQSIDHRDLFKLHLQKQPCPESRLLLVWVGRDPKA